MLVQAVHVVVLESGHMCEAGMNCKLFPLDPIIFKISYNMGFCYASTCQYKSSALDDTTVVDELDVMLKVD